MSPLADAIYDVIKEKHGGVSFVELEHLPGFQGDYEWYLEPYNVVLWPQLSHEAILAIQELQSEKLIHLYPTTVLVYLCDGSMPRLPIATQARRYKKPRWMPVVFNLGPAKNRKTKAH